MLISVKLSIPTTTSNAPHLMAPLNQIATRSILFLSEDEENLCVAVFAPCVLRLEVDKLYSVKLKSI